ncbi:MAG: hypothetical protein AAB534_00340, partial [Patescibacteria group bacterium]
MNDLVLEGKKYISSRRASEISGYDSDYLGQLCRAGKLDCRLISRTWFLTESSLRDHQNNNGRKKINVPVPVQNYSPILPSKRYTPIIPKLSDSDLFYTDNQKIALEIAKEEIVERNLLERKTGKNILNKKFLTNSVCALAFGLVVFFGILDINDSLAKTKISSGFFDKFGKTLSKILPNVKYETNVENGFVLVRETLVETYDYTKNRIFSWFDTKVRLADLKLKYPYGLSYKEFKNPLRPTLLGGVKMVGGTNSSYQLAWASIKSLALRDVERFIRNFLYQNPNLVGTSAPVNIYNLSSSPTNTYITNNHFGNQVNATYNSFENTIGRLTTTDIEEGTNLYYTNARSRSSISSSATGLSYDNSTGIFSLTSGYNVPLTASTTNWNNFYDTPSNRITAGTGLSWSGNTLNSIGGGGGGDSAWTVGNGFIYNATSSDNVGVGTTSPNSRLSVQGN